MNRILKTTVVSVALAATALTAVAPAQAHDRWHRHGRHDGGGEIIAAGILGLAVGAIAAGALNDEPQYRPRPVYQEPIYETPRDPMPRPRPVRPYYAEPSVITYDSGGLEPWSRGWFDYCSETYRSFNPDTGTFVGFDGQEHFCVAN